jgi:ammonia channel protein AmtB
MWGYSLAFGTDIGEIIGSLENVFLNGISVYDIWSVGNIPTLLFVAFHLTFAAIAVALVSGAVIERMKFEAWLISVILDNFCIFTCCSLGLGWWIFIKAWIVRLCRWNGCRNCFWNIRSCTCTIIGQKK